MVSVIRNTIVKIKILSICFAITTTPFREWHNRPDIPIKVLLFISYHKLCYISIEYNFFNIIVNKSRAKNS